MLIIPAIDLKDGKVVRLLRGKFDQKTVYSGDPVKTARYWQSQGAKYLHIVDLDGAKRGRVYHLGILREIVKNVKIPVEFGGGVRKNKSIKQVLNCGVARVVLGTKLQDEKFLLGAFKEFRQRIIISIDAQEGIVQVNGWQKAYKSLDVLRLARKLEDIGFKQAIYTDITRDGTLKGPNIAKIKRILKNSGLRLIASGGISSLQDLLKLKALSKQGLDGVIVGKALYEGRFTLREAQRGMLIKKRLSAFLLIVPFMLGGCAITQKDPQIQTLQERVSALENQILNKDSRIAELTNSSDKAEQEMQELLEIIEEKEARVEDLTRSLEEINRKKLVLPKSEGKSYYSFVIRIQTALKNAGFALGIIDGKIGSRTRTALKEFQRANGLPVDGQVDKQTWELLRNYLE